MSQVAKAGEISPMEMSHASGAGIALEVASRAYSHIGKRFEDKDWVDVDQLKLPEPTALQREIDYRALLRSVDWYLEPLRELQPRSFAAFHDRGVPELLLLEAVWTDAQFGPMNAWHLFISTNGRLLELAIGDGEEGYSERMQSDTWLSLPGEISRSWLWRSTGWKLPRQVPSNPMEFRQMICGMITQGVDDILQTYGGKASTRTALVKDFLQRFPDIVPSRKGGRIELRCFLDTRPLGVSGPVGDQFFTRSRMRDGVVYHIRNGDAASLHVLQNPVEAIDCYHEHLLLRKPGEFDFSPWSRPL